MKLYDFKDISKIFIVGDIHGEFKEFFNVLKNGLSIKKDCLDDDVHPLIKEENERMKNVVNQQMPMFADFLTDSPTPKRGRKNKYAKSVIFVAGDCGFGFYKEQYYLDVLKGMNEVLKQNDSYIIFIRGNHDDPSYFENNKLGFDRIICVEDYSVVKTKNATTLCVGGAISIDRVWRKQQELIINKYSKSFKKKLYWENENVSFNIEKLDDIYKNGIKIDSVITHTSPDFAKPLSKDFDSNWFLLDANLKYDLNNERKALTDLYNNLIENENKIKYWGYGHFHLNLQQLYENTVFSGQGLSKNPTDILQSIDQIKKIEELKNNLRQKEVKMVPVSGFDFTIEDRPMHRNIDVALEELIGEPMAINDEELEMNNEPMEIGRNPF